jgi:hypothetical protein
MCCAVIHHATQQLVKDTLRSNIAIDAMRVMLKLSSPSEATSSDDFSKAIDAREVRCIFIQLHDVYSFCTSCIHC